MGWVSPTLGAEFSVAQIVTAAQMNKITDNTRYLKGLDGTIYLQDKVGILTSSPTGALSVGANNDIYISSTDPNTINSAGGANVDTGNMWLNYRGYADGFTRFRDLNIGNGKGVAIGVFKGATGDVIFGAGTPAGKLHAEGNAGRFLFFSQRTSGGTLATLAPAGAVTVAAMLFWSDTTTAAVGTKMTSPLIGSVVLLSGSGSYVNNGDTMSYAITAGGAITIQRTSAGGTPGDHNINAMVLAV